jgi:hypothetical protein
MPGADYVVLATDRNLTVVGDPISCWTSLDVTLKFNEPGAGILTTPGYPWVTAQIVPGNRIVIIRNGTVLLAGPIEGWKHERSDNGAQAGDGVLTVNFADDLASIVARNTYPNPAKTVETQDLDKWAFTGNAELALRALVNTQAGPGALAPRRVPQLALGALAGVGVSVTVNADRMQPLGDVARETADVGGGLGFRARQSGTQILFEVYAPPDKSGTVRFGFGLGNLRYIAHQVQAPTATSVEVGGQGVGASSYMIERTNPVDETAWGRVERFVGRDGTSALAVLQDDGDLELDADASTTQITVNVSDTPDQQYGTHYQLGDKVAVESWPGQQFADIIRTIHFQVYATAGEYVAATIGSQAATTDPQWVQRTNEINQRLGQIERHVTPA